MQTVIFHDTIFGPIKSRRFGTSLGVNLMPNDGKICSFDCLYCEAGFNAQGMGTTGVPKRETVKRLLKQKLEQMKAAGETLDVITFSGNGEPTVHPQFKEIVHDVINERNRYFPDAKVTVLSNATMAAKQHVKDALKLVDNNVLKLDSALPRTMRLINRPVSPNVLPEGIIEDLKAYNGRLIVQTMMLRGEHNGATIDNTTPQEIKALIDAYLEIKPRSIMLYSIDRATPEQNLMKVEAGELRDIARQITEATGINVEVTA